MRIRLFRAFATIVLACAVLSTHAPVADAQTSVQKHVQFEADVTAAKENMVINPYRALNKAKNAEVLANDFFPQEKSVFLATALWLQGEAYLQINDNTHAAPIIDHAIKLIFNSQSQYKLKGDLLLSNGGVKSALGDVAGALASYQRAYKIYSLIDENRSCAIALISIANLYQEAKDYTNSLKYYDQAGSTNGIDLNLLYVISNNRGSSLKEIGKFADAKIAFNKGLRIANLLKNSLMQARTLNNIARNQLLAGQIDAADRTITQGFSVSRGDDATSSRYHFLVLSAWSARLHGRLPEAQRLIARAFANADPNSSTIDQREGHQVAYDIYKRAGNQAQALIHLETLKQSDDQTSKLAASANTALAAARFDFANQALNIEKLKRQRLQRNIDDAKLRARTQQTIFGGLAVAAVIIVAMLAFGLVTIRRSRNEVRAANVDLAQTNAALGKALAAKTEFLATTSHEIRTPLNGILGMTQVMLADRSLSEPLRDRIGVVHGAGVTMRALVDDILDVAKMETGNLTIERIPFDLKASLRDVSQMWEEQARSKGLTFVLDLDDCPAFIEGDAARLRQIAFNLLSNALKFTERGQVTMRASADGQTLALAVGDTGIGIPADKLDIIFESFRQVDAGTTRKFGGTGLGLAICRNLAQAMDGDVVVTSVPDVGSTFTLRLPLLAAAPAVAATEAAVRTGALLIVDRNPISRSMLRAVLEARAGTVTFASGADEAVARIAEGGIARVLIDDATIKAADDPGAALAAVGATDTVSAVLWAAPDAADRARFAAAGIDRVIAKPIAGAALAAILFDATDNDDSAASRLVTRAA